MKKKCAAKCSPKLKGTTVTRLWVLCGFAVAFADRVEYWQYDPSILTQKQRNSLGIKGFKDFKVAVQLDKVQVK